MDKPRNEGSALSPSKGVEVSARTVDEAVLRALQELGLGHDDVEVEVVKQGSRGLLGLLSEEAVVRVTPKASSVASHEPVAAGQVPELQESAMGEEAEEARGEEPRERPQSEDQAESARRGVEMLQTLLNHIGLSARVTQEATSLKSEAGPAPTLLNITGDNLGLLIGRRGETLRDLQFLTCLMVSRHAQRWPNLIVDVEHYKFRREKSLVDLARRMADRVRTTAQPVSLEPMPAYERRIVHLALRDDPDVRTESTGQDEKRKVVILPKN